MQKVAKLPLMRAYRMKSVALLANNLQDVPEIAPTRLLLVRHGQSEWNALGKMQGHADSPLSAEGRKQARNAARRLGVFDLIISSDLQRASETANLIAEEMGLSVLPPHPGLREINVGPWQGLTRREIDKKFPGYVEHDMRPPGYEPDHEVFARVSGALNDIARDHPGAMGLVVTHSGIIRVMRRTLGYPDQRNHRNLEGCWFTLHPDGGLEVSDSVNILRNTTTSDTL
jgi:probable phosphoglycerate mutase